MALVQYNIGVMGWTSKVIFKKKQNLILEQTKLLVCAFQGETDTFFSKIIEASKPGEPYTLCLCQYCCMFFAS